MAHRIRVSHDIHDVGVHRRQWDGNGNLVQNYVAATRHMAFHEMIDDHVEDPVLRRVKPCGHAKLTVTHSHRPNIQHLWAGHDSHTPPIWPSGEPVTSKCSVPFPRSFMSVLSDQAFEALMVQVPQEVSIPNFLWELRELKDLIPKVQENLVKTASSAYLINEFGIQPMLGDIQRIRNLSTTVLQRIAYLKATYGKETRVSFSRSFTDMDTGAAVVVSAAQTEGMHLRSWKGTFRCGGYLFHKLEGLDGIEGTLRGMVGALGLNNPLGVLWEATRLSFVADWFGRTDGILARTALQPFVGTWDIRRLTHSTTVDTEWEEMYGPIPNTQAPWNQPVSVLRLKGRNYHRNLGLPAASTWLTSKSLDPRQLMLAAALIGAASR